MEPMPRANARPPRLVAHEALFSRWGESMRLEASSLSSAMIIKSIVTHTYVHDHARYNNASIDGPNVVPFIQE